MGKYSEHNFFCGPHGTYQFAYNWGNEELDCRQSERALLEVTELEEREPYDDEDSEKTYYRKTEKYSLSAFVLPKRLHHSTITEIKKQKGFPLGIGIFLEHECGRRYFYAQTDRDAYSDSMISTMGEYMNFNHISGIDLEDDYWNPTMRLQFKEVKLWRYSKKYNDWIVLFEGKMIQKNLIPTDDPISRLKKENWESLTCYRDEDMKKRQVTMDLHFMLQDYTTMKLSEKNQQAA